MRTFITYIFYIAFLCQFITAFIINPSCNESIEVGRICNFATLEQSMKHAFYFEPSKNCCAPFNYLGCGGNGNNFFSLGRCIKACLPWEGEDDDNDDIDAPAESVRVQADCLLKPDNGPCRALISMWYYDKDIKNCSTFSYGGCQGNGNRFDGIEKCNEFCKGVDENAVEKQCNVTTKRGICPR